MVSLKDLVPLVVDAHTDWRILLLKNWDTIVGFLSTRTRLEKVTPTMIVVGVYESHWMQELYLLSPVLIDSINNFLGKPYIKQARFKLVEERTMPSHFKAPEKKRMVVGEIVLTRNQQRALDKISDPQMKEALIGFWGKCQVLSSCKSSPALKNEKSRTLCGKK